MGNNFSHTYWMSKCIELAKKTVGADPDPVSAQYNEVPIAALVIKENKLLSSAVNKTETNLDPTAHAEIIVIREASKVLSNWRLNGCTLYTTLEPCAMCCGAIINSRISTVVFGAYDSVSGACGSAFHLINELNKNNQIEVIGGIMELEASRLIKSFFSTKR
ncbi:MAG: hypothetical protein A3B68_00860 [Candidatus Melainabacteria bacterium RIFCSPHIGHO2_02_FULL_34_12]|nr:MAG: hypothetical protein A3B68_00860 [Candidatus Melainabacteria bacterium RIFCSPHIGHO2_02_FULL_34_12]